MSVRTTSLLAYIGINADGTAKKQRGRIFLFIQSHPNHTRLELSKLMGISISSLCGRIRGLLDSGAIKELPARMNGSTGRLASPLIALDVDDETATSFQFKNEKQSGKELTILLHRIIGKACKPKPAYGGKPSTYNTLNVKDDDLALLKRLSGFGE